MKLTPDPKAHLYISLVKSSLRFAAGFALINSSFIISGWFFITAEILGILEELF